MSEFTNLEDANSLKRMGLPLNMPSSIGTLREKAANTSSPL